MGEQLETRRVWSAGERGRISEAARDLLPAVLEFIREGGPDLLPELAVQLGKEVPVLRALVATAEKLADADAQKAVERTLANVEAMISLGQADLASLREDTNRLVLLSSVMYARQGDILARLGNASSSHRLTESAIELALVAHRGQLVLEHQYADHRGIADSANRQEIASLPLEDVYVLPRLAPERAEEPPQHERERDVVRRLTAVDFEDLSLERRRELEEQYAALTGERWKASAEHDRGHSLGAVLAQHRRVVVLGGPGAGKSVMIRFLARVSALGPEAMQRRLGWKEDVTPVVLSLAAFSAERRERPGLELSAYLDVEMERRGGEALRVAIARELAAGSLLLLLDGVDEEPDRHRRASLVQAVDVLLESAGQSRCLVTSRPHGYFRLRGEIAHHTLLPFSRQQIEEFVRGWHLTLERRRHPAAPDLAAAEREAASLLDEIRHDSRVESLAGNPLMLVVISLIRQERVRLPQQRVLLYERAVRTLIDTWNDWRSRPKIDVGGAVLPYDRMVRVWGAVARWLHGERPTGIVHREKLRSVLVDVLRELDDSADPELTAVSYLNAAAQRAGLLEERGTNIFAFWHPTFQEFLAAADLVTPLSKAESRVLEVRDDPRWREVIVLAVGVAGIVRQEPETATSLVRAILDSPPPSVLEPLFHARLRLAAACAADDAGVRRVLRDEVIRRLSEVVVGVPDHQVARSFIVTVRRLGDHQPTAATVQALLGATTHSDWEVRMEAARILGNVSTTNAVARERCELLLNDPDSDVHCHAAIGFTRAGDVRLSAALALRHVDSPHAHLERPAIESLLSSSDRITAVLVGALDDADAGVRVQAADALVSLGQADERAVVALVGALDDADAGVRAQVAEALGNLGQTYEGAVVALGMLGKSGERAVTALVGALDDADAGVRVQAADALVRLGQADERAVAALVGALDNAEAWVRVQAAEALGNLGQTYEGAVVAPGMLGKSGERAVTALVGALDDADAVVRVQAADTLVRLGQADERAVVALVGALDNAEAWVRMRAMGALGNLGQTYEGAVVAPGMLGQSDEWAVAALVGVLDDADIRVRVQAANALVSLGQADERAVVALVGALDNAEAWVHERAMEALVRLGQSDERAVVALVGVLRDAAIGVRVQAAEALGMLGQAAERAVVALVGALDDAEAWVRVRAAEALVSLGQADERAVVALVGALDDADAWVRMRAAVALVRLGQADERTVVALVGALDNAVAGGRWHAVEALGMLGQVDERVVVALVGALDDAGPGRPSEAVVACRCALGNQPLTDAQVAALLRVLASEPADNPGRHRLKALVFSVLARRVEAAFTEQPGS